jgi:hypothetical protein
MIWFGANSNPNFGLLDKLLGRPKAKKVYFRLAGSPRATKEFFT